MPPTVLRDGPLGPGSVQLWIGDPYEPLPDDLVVDLVPEGRTPPGWHEVLDGETPSGSAVTVVHSPADDVRSLAVLDAAINNSDRKGSHCLRDRSGRLWAIDHGVSLSAEPKLRTVLWGWAGERLPEAELERLERLSRRPRHERGPGPARGVAARARRRGARRRGCTACCASAPTRTPARGGPPCRGRRCDRPVTVPATAARDRRRDRDLRG